VTISLPNFTRGPQQPVNLPADVSTGIPISFSDGGNISSATFTLSYNPALLTITGGAPAPGLPGATVNVNTTTPGTAIVQFNSPTPLPPGTTRFLDLQANVPAGAPYRSKHVLNINTISLNGGAIPAIDDDAIHLVAYFGDANGSNTYTSADAALTSRVAIGLDQGLASYRLIDPVIVIDLNESGGITSADSSRSLQLAVGTIVSSVPFPLPGGAVTPGGPDPKLSIPNTLVAEAGSVVTIPVQIDSIVDLTGTGLLTADLVLFYDPAVVTINTVNLGSLLTNAGGWIVSSRIDRLAGRVSVSLVGKTPLEGVFGGDLVELLATVAADTPAGTMAINLAESAKNPAQYTSLNDGNLTLIPAPTDAADDPGDGLLTIIAPAQEIVSPVRMVNDQLIIGGTTASERILVARIQDELIRVRINNRIVGEYPLGAGVVVDALGGDDHVILSGLPPTLVVTPAEDRSNVVVFGDDPTAVVSSLSSNLGLRDEALLQLLAAWSAQQETADSSSAVRSARFRRL
jgi:hypothetical protein